ncbi:MAG TPA: autotransporter-associated beta strand repeat-containing protein, partial [Thermoanaerobaculia bacterium]|nr:autotransporter-associated beta strand repeat-containing protein [Thermoanaerobaculia bacterium]
TQTFSVAGGGTLNLPNPIDTGNGGVGHTLVFDGAGNVNVSGNVLGIASVTTNGTGTLTLSGANSYSGQTQVNAGRVIISDPTALGTNAAGTVVNGGVLQLQGGITVDEGLIIQGPGFLGSGALVSASGVNLWTGTVAVPAAGVNIGVTAGSLEIQGIVSGPGALNILTGAGGPMLLLSGVNTYTGLTTLVQGRLGAKSAGAFGATTSGAVVQTGTLELEGVTIVGEALTLNGDGDGAAFGALRSGGMTASDWNAPVTLATNTTITASVNNLTVATGIAGSGGLTKEGAATLFLGSGTYTGATVVNGGAIDLSQSLATSSVTVNDTGKLEGVSTFAGPLSVLALGTVAPGHSPGVLNVGNTSFQAASVYDVEINGPTAGTNYDQLNVTGTVSLSAPTLVVHVGFMPSEGQAFTIVNNNLSDAVSGIFSAKPNGSGFIADGVELQIAYNGGSGNDVVLTAHTIPSAAITPVGPTILCSSQLLTATPSNGVPSYTGFQWYKDAVLIPSATMSTYTANAPGTYTVTVTDSLAVTSAQSTASVLNGETTAPTVMAPLTATVTETTCS